MIARLKTRITKAMQELSTNELGRMGLSATFSWSWSKHGRHQVFFYYVHSSSSNHRAPEPIGSYDPNGYGYGKDPPAGAQEDDTEPMFSR